MKPFRVTAYLARAHLQFAAERGLSLAPTLEAHGVGAADLADDEAEIDVQAMNALWRAMEALVGPDYGVQLAEHGARSVGVVDYCARHAADGAASLRALIAYQRLLHGPARSFFLDEDARAGTTTVRFVPPPFAQPLPRSVAEFVLARVLAMLRRNTARGDLAPRRVGFRHAAPASLARHAQHFRCPVDFGAPVDALVLDADALAAPLPAADPALGRILDRHAAELCARRPRELTVLADVRRALVEGLRGGVVPEADAVARRLATSPRTLRRRLADADTSFQSVVDEVRRELAASYLRDPGIKTAEVAFLLGFAEVSTFHRAFRRWTGTTPVTFRRRALATAANPLAGDAKASVEPAR